MYMYTHVFSKNVTLQSHLKHDFYNDI